MTPGPPLPTLLSHLLVAFTIEYDNAFEARVAHRMALDGRGGRRHARAPCPRPPGPPDTTVPALLAGPCSPSPSPTSRRSATRRPSRTWPTAALLDHSVVTHRGGYNPDGS